MTATHVLRAIRTILECGKFKNRLRRESFRFRRRVLLERGLNMHFSPKIRHILPPCDNCDIKNGRKRVMKFGQPWLTLTVQLFWYVLLTVAIFGCVSGQRTSCLFLSLCFVFNVPRWRLGQDRLRKMKSEFTLWVKTIDNSWKDEKMRALALRRNVAEKPRGMRLKFVLSQLRTCTHENKKMFVFFKSWARVSRVQPRKTRWSQF